MAKKEKAEAPAAKVQVISMTKGVTPKFRAGSARDLYYQVYMKHDGKPLSVAEAAIAKDVPAVPKKGKLAGKPEPVSGWTRWFVRNGYFSLQS